MTEESDGIVDRILISAGRCTSAFRIINWVVISDEICLNKVSLSAKRIVVIRNQELSGSQGNRKKDWRELHVENDKDLRYDVDGACSLMQVGTF